MHALEKFGLAPLASFGTSTSSALLRGVCAAVGTYLERSDASSNDAWDAASSAEVCGEAD